MIRKEDFLRYFEKFFHFVYIILFTIFLLTIILPIIDFFITKSFSDPVSYFTNIKYWNLFVNLLKLLAYFLPFFYLPYLISMEFLSPKIRSWWFNIEYTRRYSIKGIIEKLIKIGILISLIELLINLKKINIAFLWLFLLILLTEIYYIELGKLLTNFELASIYLEEFLKSKNKEHLEKGFKFINKILKGIIDRKFVYSFSNFIYGITILEPKVEKDIKDLIKILREEDMTEIIIKMKYLFNYCKEYRYLKMLQSPKTTIREIILKIITSPYLIIFILWLAYNVVSQYIKFLPPISQLPFP